MCFEFLIENRPGLFKLIKFEKNIDENIKLGRI